MLVSALTREVRLRLRHVIGPVIGGAVLIYVTYNGINGDRGLLAWRTYEKQVSEAKAELKKVSAEREALAAQVMLLHPESLDKDMLDEWARRLLNYGKPDEIVIFLNDQKPN
jgi:cell division protein FtsB